MHEFKVVLNRITSQRMNENILDRHAEYLKDAGLRGRGRKHWHCSYKSSFQGLGAKGYSYCITMLFNKEGGRNNLEVIYKDKDDICSRIAKAGQNTKFNKYPWEVIEEVESSEKSSDESEVTTEKVKNTQKIGEYEAVTRPEEIIIPEVLLSGTDQEIENYEVFKGIYGRSAQIRTAMSVLHAAFSTKMQRRHNILFWGYPGCAKSHLVSGIKDLIGKNAFLELDSTSTTKAGIEKIFLESLDKGIPPVVIIEEIEKTDENALRVWLSALDERREIRKVNFNVAKVRKPLDIVCIATANDKIAFDKLFRASNQEGRGALSSRFTKQIYCPRPEPSIMKRILERDIKEYGGKKQWIEPCINLYQQLEITDPREVLGLLVGGDRLLDQSFQNDLLKIHQQQKKDYEEQ